MTAMLGEFWSSVTRTDGCWTWTGYVSHLGYGEVGHRRGHRPSPSQTRLAHRIAYELLIGPIPSGLHLDHLCRNRACVNPAHLEPVTASENTRRGLHGVLRTHCRYGHLLSPDNVRVRRSDGARRCRACDRHAMRMQVAEMRRGGISNATQSGMCAACGKSFGLRNDGRIRHHSESGRRGDAPCPGAGQVPLRAELSALPYGESP